MDDAPVAPINVCGVCQQQFATEADYNQHTCTTGKTPQDPEHFGNDFLAVQKAALERGKADMTDPDQIATQDAAIAEIDAKIAEGNNPQ